MALAEPDWVLMAVPVVPLADEAASVSVSGYNGGVLAAEAASMSVSNMVADGGFRGRVGASLKVASASSTLEIESA